MKEQFTYNGHEYNTGDKIKIVSTFGSQIYGEKDDVGEIYTIVGWLESDDGNQYQLIEVEKREDSDRKFITKWDEFEPVEEEKVESPLVYKHFTRGRQEKLCRRYSKDITSMTSSELLELLSSHLDNILVEGLE